MPEAVGDLHVLWQTRHRGQLHEISSWNADGRGREEKDALPPRHVSLTYVPSGAGATGTEQLEQFIALFPSNSHPFNAHQLFRFNNKFEVLSCSVDHRQRIVTEEVAVSALHSERLDYLLPGFEATRKQLTLVFVTVAKYAENGLLDEVRIYWDHAMLLKQLGVFETVLHNVISASGKAAAFENALEALPISDGIRIARRLFSPTLHNCNALFPLPLPSMHQPEKTLNSSENYFSRPFPSPTTAGTAIMGGLESLTEVGQGLPDASDARPLLAKNTPALSSSVFSSEHDGGAAGGPVKWPHSDTPALRSTLVMGDGSDERPRAQAYQKQSRSTLLGGDERDERNSRSSIALDPTRNQSCVFKEPASPFHPSVPLTDRSRFDSKIFSKSPVAAANLPRPQNSSQFSSTIFDVVSDNPVQPSSARSLARSTPFATDSDHDPALHTGRKTSASHLESHFHGSGFEFCSVPSDPRTHTVRSADVHSNRSSIQFNDNFGEPSLAKPLGGVTSHNQSQLQLGDDAPDIPIYLSSRVLQPPGGRSSNIFE